jgi:hypothetical protein
MLSQLDADLVDQLRRRLVRNGLLAAVASGRNLFQAADGIAQRLHDADGSCEKPPSSVPVAE